MKLYSTPDEDSDAYGPGTDLMLSLFAGVLAMVCFLAVIQHQLRKEKKILEGQVTVLQGIIVGKDEEIRKINDRLKNLETRDLLTIDLTEKGREGMSGKEKESIAFIPGNYAIRPALKKFIDLNILPEIRRNLHRLSAEVDTLELTGHTDDTGLGSEGRMNIDKGLVAWLAPSDQASYHVLDSNEKMPPPLKSGSNVELGFLRAVNVALYLKSCLKDEFPNLKFRFNSAGPAVFPDKLKINQRDDPSRRRIEIRFTKGRGAGLLD